ncbi:hypothetical protein PGIGA_G00245830 [Pangasianodon gigas]|uniref:Uncharacterized protein n=1 Tax=Pangasianodon gigas TaxID=30993 RepID=A0ACC5WPX4_PANGG|nr:hypothetical protein [Pangasianodon gigas]
MVAIWLRVIYYSHACCLSRPPRGVSSVRQRGGVERDARAGRSGAFTVAEPQWSGSKAGEGAREWHRNAPRRKSERCALSLPYNPTEDGTRRALCNAHASGEENKETQSVKGQVIARDAPCMCPLADGTSFTTMAHVRGCCAE